MSSDEFLKRWRQIVDLYSKSCDETSYAAIVHDNRLQWRLAQRRRSSSNRYSTSPYELSFSFIEYI